MQLWQDLHEGKVAAFLLEETGNLDRGGKTQSQGFPLVEMSRSGDRRHTLSSRGLRTPGGEHCELPPASMDRRLERDHEWKAAVQQSAPPGNLQCDFGEHKAQHAPLWVLVSTHRGVPVSKRYRKDQRWASLFPLAKWVSQQTESQKQDCTG